MIFSYLQAPIGMLEPNLIEGDFKMNLKINEYGQQLKPTILFLHGLGVSSWMWQEQVEALQAQYHLLTVDLPGSGDSYQAEWQSFGETAVQLADIIRRRATNGQAHVIGLSLGGYVALSLAAEWPEVVLSTIVSGVTVRPFPKQWFYRPLFRLMSHAARWDMVIKLNLKMMQMPEEVHEIYRRDSKRVTAETSQRIYAELLNFSLPVELQKNRRPLLAVAGEKEAGLILESLAEYNEVPNAMTAIIPNAHHAWTGEFPDLFNEMVVAWVESRSLPEKLEHSKSGGMMLAVS